MKKRRTCLKMIAVIIMISGLSACEAIPIISGGLSLVNTSLLYKIKNTEKVNVTTISKDCHLYQYLCLTQQTKDSISMQDWDVIAFNNRVMTQQCPNIDKPNCKDVIAARSNH